MSVEPFVEKGGYGVYLIAEVEKAVAERDKYRRIAAEACHENALLHVENDALGRRLDDTEWMNL